MNSGPTPKIQSLASALAASSCGDRAFADAIQGKWAGGGGGLIHGCVSSGGGADTRVGHWPEGRAGRQAGSPGGTWDVPPEGPGHPWGIGHRQPAVWSILCSPLGLRAGRHLLRSTSQGPRKQDSKLSRRPVPPATRGPCTAWP